MIKTPKKRKSGGRSKGAKGRVYRVPCAACGKLVPRDKAKKIVEFKSIVTPDLAVELRKKGAYIPKVKVVKYYCISCAVYRGLYPPRAKDERKKRLRRRKRK